SSSTCLSPYLHPAVYVHAPQRYYEGCGVPSQPPCPRCGWKAVTDRKVISKGWTEGRRVSGVFDDMFMIGTKHRCATCKEKKKSLEARAKEWRGDADEKQRRVSEAKAHSFTFRSYDPDVTKCYNERYPWIAAANKVVVCNHKTAMTLELAYLMKRLMTTGSSPHDMMRLLQEMKGVQYTLDQTVYYGYQQYIRSSLSPLHGQPKMTEMFERQKRKESGAAGGGVGGAHGPVQVMTRKARGMCCLGHGVLRRFYIEHSDRKADFEHLWRELNVSSDVVAIDHTMKVFMKSKISGQRVFNARATVFGNKQLCPLLSLFVSTTSFDDPAMKLGCDALYQSFKDKFGDKAEFKVCYVDNPNRDAKGAARLLRLPSCVPVERQFRFTGHIDILRKEEEVDKAVARLRSDAAVSKIDSARVVGFDMEWHAPRVRGVSPSRTALIQICSSAGFCAVFVMADMVEVPSGLRDFLQDPTIKKVGNNISGDVTKLCKDFPDLEGSFANYSELTSLTSRPETKRSLAELVAMVSDKEMDKDLGEGALADWSSPELTDEQLLYAANDAYAGVLVWSVLEKQRATLLKNLGQSEPERSEAGEPAVRGGAKEPVVSSGGGAHGDDRAENGRGGFELPPDMLEEVEAGVPAAAWLVGEGVHGDDRDDDEEEVHVLPEDDNWHSSTPEVAMCMLRKAEIALVEYSKSERTSELRMPPQLSSKDRQALHSVAESLGIAHKSEGEGDQRCLVFSRRSGQCTLAPELARVNLDWARSRVKYDIRHWMGNLFLMANTKDSALFKYFCVAISDAVYMIVPSSRDQVHAHLKFLGLSEDEIKRVRRKYWRSKARYVVPPPAELLRRLTDVYDFFCDLVDPSTGRNFFVADHNKRFRHEMTYVVRGDLSDIPGEDMYIEVGTYKSGLPRLICLRSSSPIEGYHLHLANTVGAMARKASPRWLEGVTNQFDTRWCITALKKQGLIPTWVEHFDLELYDILYLICVKLGVSDQVLPGHRPTPMTRQPRVRHGLHFALTATKNTLERQPASAELFSAAPSRAEGVGGLHESLLPRSSAAKCFIKDTVKDVAAWDLLKQKNYFD
ncbi:unnamed protein product, partial [Ectocarpus fasciculatus]